MVNEEMRGRRKLADKDLAPRRAFPAQVCWPMTISGPSPCEILIPAALGSQITADKAGKSTPKLIIEGVNGPTTPEVDDSLESNGVMVLPDVIANAGGVTVSYFEWVQDLSSCFWTEDEINARLVRIMKDAFAGVWNTAQQHSLSLSTAPHFHRGIHTHTPCA